MYVTIGKVPYLYYCFQDLFFLPLGFMCLIIMYLGMNSFRFILFVVHVAS